MPRIKKRNASKTTLRLYDRVQELATILGRGDKTAGIEKLFLRFENEIQSGVCPKCGKPFDECEYFKRLDKE